MKNKIDSSMIKSFIWTMIGMIIITTLTYFTVYGNFLFWNVIERRTFISLTVIGYLFSSTASLQIKRFSFREQISIAAFILTAVIAIFLSVVAIGRFYYSRSYLVIYYIFSFAWISLGLFLYRNPRNFFYLICPVGLGVELAKKGSRRWELLREPEVTKKCDGIIIDLHEKIPPEWMRFIANISLTNISIYHAATVFEKVTGKISLKHLSEGIASKFKPSKYYSFVKQILESFTIFLFSPIVILLCCFTALVIKINSRGSVFFIQERMGLRGKPFKMYKFRTMITDSEANGVKFTSSNDSRIIPMGKFLRKFRLDELPQLLNVLNGTMSLIGPRPEQVSFAKDFEREIPFYAYRHLVKPGITGWSQVVFGYAAGIEETAEKLGYDLYYIKYMGFSIDFIIVIKTLKTILTGFGSK